MPRKKRIVLMVVPIILIISIIAIILILLYFKTDIFKSDKTLFKKYIGLNVQNMEETYQFVLSDEYNNRLNEKKYKDNTHVKINYTENIGTSLENTNNSINNIELNIEGQTDAKNGYNYKNFTLSNQGKNEMQVEYIQNQNSYGIRFTDLFKQYLLVENDGLKDIFKKLGYDNDIVNVIPDKIDYEIDEDMFSFSDEEKETLKNDYLDLIDSIISENNFSKEIDQIIKINNKDTSVNKYKLIISKRELNTICVKFLENLKQDEIILGKINKIQNFIDKFKVENNSSYNIEEAFINYIDEEIEYLNGVDIEQGNIEISVYESNGDTVRTSIKTNEYVVNLDFLLAEENKYMRN